MMKAAALSAPGVPVRRPVNARLASVATSAAGPAAGAGVVDHRHDVATIMPMKTRRVLIVRLARGQANVVADFDGADALRSPSRRCSTNAIRGDVARGCATAA